MAYRVKALVDFSDVKAGECGGFVCRENNLSHEGNAWVCGNAGILDNAVVKGDAVICDNALVYDDADVSGNVKMRKLRP